MKIILTKDYEEMSAKAAEIVGDVVRKKPDCVIGLATGETLIGLYSALAEECKAGRLDFSKVITVNLDEYYPIAPANPQSYRYFMNTHLFDMINIDKANTYVPQGNAPDPEAACAEYSRRIEEIGIDIQVLGIGRNGHIGFNEPDAGGLIARTHLTALTTDTIDANSRFFDSADEVPTHAMTMGIGDVFSAKKIIMLVNGTNKAQALRSMIKGPIDTMCPASLLCLHGDVTVVCDEAAYSLLK